MADGGLFTDISNIIAGLINSGNLDLAHDIEQAMLEKNRGLANDLSVPEMQRAWAEQTGDNAFDSVKVDPQTRAYQMEALSRLGNEVTTKGLTAEDEAAQMQALQKAGQFEAGQRGAAEQRAAARGMGGAMSSQLAALQGQQSAINSANANAIDLAGQNRQRYMQALNSLGSAATSVRGQDWSEAAQRAQAQNQLNQFNSGMRWNAQQYNLNQPQQQYQNQLAKARMQMGANAAAGQGWMDWAKGQQGPTNQTAQGFGKFGDDAMAMAGYGSGSSGGGGGGGGGGMDWQQMMKGWGGGGGGGTVSV